MEAIWETVMQYVKPFLEGGGLVAVVAILGRLVIGRMTNKVNFDTDKISKDVAKQLAKSSINVDLTAIAKKQVETIKNDLVAINTANGEVLRQLVELCALQGKALAKSKLLSEEERTDLETAAAQVLGELLPKESKEEILLTLDAPEEESEKDQIYY